MSNTINNHNIETGLVVTCFVGFMATNVMAVLAPILRISPLVLLIAALAVAGQDVDDDAAARAKDVQC